MACRTNYLLYLLVLLFSSFRLTAQTGFTIVEPLTGDQAGELALGGAARLTGGNDDALDGWLRLTEKETNQYGYAVINRPFPSSLGVEVDFEFVIWGGNGADGFSIFLFDAEYDPTLSDDDPKQFRIGGLGGGLGYAIRKTATVDEPGLTGGYIGFGIDEYGNYTVSSESKIGGVAGSREENATEGLGVRGSEASGYKWLGGKVGSDLAHVLNVNGFTLDYKGATTERPIPGLYYRRVFLAIDPVYDNGQIIHYELSAKLQIQPDSDPILVLDKLKIEDVPPDYLKVGFAAVTGGSTHIHEVRNLNVTTPADLWVRKSVNRGEAYVGDELIYTVKVMNQFDLQADYLELKDVLPGHFQVEHITYTDDGKPGTGIVSGWIPGDLDMAHVILNLAPFSEAVFEIKGRVAPVTEDMTLVSIATFDATDQTGFSDTKQENNVSLVTTRIIVPKIAVENERFDMKIGLPLSSEEMNVLENDQIDGNPIDLQAFELLVVLPAQAVNGGEVPELNVSTGNIQLPSRMTIGEYEIVYRIVELINPNNYKDGTVVVKIEPNVLIAEIDNFGTFREGKEYRTANVLDNDMWNNIPLDPQKIQFSWIDAAPTGIVLHDEGTIEIRSAAKEGDYVLLYSICEVDNSTNCSEATVRVHVRNVLAAQDDYYELIIDRGNVMTPSVLENDISEDLSASVSELRLIPGKPSHPSMNMNEEGIIFFPEGTRVGRYIYPYTVCELGQVDNCQSAVAIIDIKAKDLFVPNIITPNRDGFNDCLEVIGYEYYDKMELLVFNSGGIEVYRNVDYKNDWDASHLPQDIYYYILYLKKGNQNTVHKGYVHVKR